MHSPSPDRTAAPDTYAHADESTRYEAAVDESRRLQDELRTTLAELRSTLDRFEENVRGFAD